MGAVHAHGGRAGRGARAPVRLRRGPAAVLWVAVLVLVAMTAGGVLLLWPHGRGSGGGPLPPGALYADPVEAVVLSVGRQACPGVTASPADGVPDGVLMAEADCPTVTARLLGGPEAGSVRQVPVPEQVAGAGLAAGDRVVLARFREAPTAGAGYGWADYSRRLPLSLLALAFLGVVLLVARWRGITALAGLALGYATIAGFMLPALRLGEHPLAVAVCGSVAIMVVILYVAHGISAKTTAALLGTVFGLALAASLAWWAARSAHLDGLSAEDNLSLTRLPGAGLAGVILCGIVLAGLGVLNDVTVTQASAVWEIAEQAPHLGARALFASGMRVGRDHLASTVYTIAFAYAGAALPTLMLVDMFDTPWRQVVTGGEVAEEVVRTLVGSIGLVLAIPVTTAVTALVVALGRVKVEVPAEPAAAPHDFESHFQ